MRVLLELLELLLKLVLSVDEFTSLLKEPLPLGVNQILSFVDDHPFLLKLLLQLTDLADKLSPIWRFQYFTLDIKLALASDRIFSLLEPILELLNLLLVTHHGSLAYLQRRLKECVP